MGYPLSSEPLTEFRRTTVILPEGTQVLDWMAGVYARLHLPTRTGPTQIAQVIIALMTQIQHVTAGEEVEITLEYISQ